MGIKLKNYGLTYVKTVNSFNCYGNVKFKYECKAINEFFFNCDAG